MKADLPRVSVIIPNFNYATYLGEAIESVLRQTYPDIEIIVVDDGSTDNSIEIANQYLNKIKLIRKINGGVSSARNEGIKISSGLYVCFLDADDIWEANKIELQLKKALEGNFGLVYSGILECDSKLTPVREIKPIYQGDCEDEYRFRPGSAVAILGTSTALISREVLHEVGFFDLELNTSADWDFLRRVSKVTDFGYVASPLVRYRRHANNMSSGSLTRYYSDNEKALNKMVAEYAKSNLRNSVINRYSKFRFNIGASSAFFKSKELRHGFRHFYKALTGIIGL
jgi:glycosyltransferase involved in cell wall biosynthesis